MRKPENYTPSHYLRNGTPIRSPKGLVHTDDELQKMKSANLGKQKNRETIEKRGFNWALVKPLYARGAITGEIKELTGLSSETILNTICWNKKYTEDWNKVEPYAVPGEENRLTRGKKFQKDFKQPLSDEKKKSIEFAKLLYSGKLITDDISNWKQIVEIYREAERKLPESFFDRLRLEVYLSTKKLDSKGDCSLNKKYSLIRNSVNPDLLDEDSDILLEESFIRSKTPSTGNDNSNSRPIKINLSSGRVAVSINNGNLTRAAINRAMISREMGPSTYTQTAKR